MALIYNYILKKKHKKHSWQKKYLKFKKKNICIPPFLKNSVIWVHQGKKLIRRIVHPFMVGHKIGEFCLTRKPFFYPQKKKKDK